MSPLPGTALLVHAVAELRLAVLFVFTNVLAGAANTPANNNAAAVRTVFCMREIGVVFIIEQVGSRFNA
jgi:hypothetical protein